jgi:DHA3 family tetracycline resistance protein-like MFS transporter
MNGPTETHVPVMVKVLLHGSATDLGLVFAAGGVGAVGAAVVVGQRGQPRRDVTWMYLCWTVATVAVVGYGLARTVPQLMLACLVFNALEAAGTIYWSTIKQRHVPSSLLGRISSLDWLISISLLPLSYAITGPVADAVGVRATLVGAGVIGAAATLGALFLPGMRDVEGGYQPLPARPSVSRSTV